MFGVNPINKSVQWLGVPDFLVTDGIPWTDNILALSSSWVNCGTTTNPNWVSQPGGPYGSATVLWSGTVCVIPAYVLRTPENMCSAAQCVRDNLLQENCTSCM